jgi:hypothetical protein
MCSAQDARAANAAWAIRAVSEPSAFSPTDQVPCEEQNCGRYQLLVANVGSEASTGGVTLTVTLPEGITTHREQVESGESSEGSFWSCTNGAGISVLTCTFPEGVTSGGYLPFLDITVNPPSPTLAGPVTAVFEIEGGGALPATRRLDTPIATTSHPPFELTQSAFEPRTEADALSSQAGGHPWQLSTTFGVSTTFSPPTPSNGNNHEIANNFLVVRNVKNVVVELPIGMLGNPQATPQCSQTQLTENHCPIESRVGEYAITAGQFELGEFANSGQFCCSAVYNMTPEQGYPAEFAFKFAGKTITLYASVIHTGSGYRLRAAAIGLPAALEVSTAILTFFGDPSAANGGASGTAFLTNPMNCGTPGPAHLAVTPWNAPQDPIATDITAYQELTGCNALRFEPTFAFQPSPGAEEGSTRADAPSAYTANLEVPQQTSYAELATPPLRSASVTLPVGVSVSPSAAQGLAGCDATGPEGINIGSSQIGSEGQDLGDPEASELGAGHAGGNGSPYDDGLYHTAPGHCPLASTLGTVEVFTPLLPVGPGGAAPLTGHVYLAEPRCGGAGQPACTEASATNGELYGLYVEAAGAGVIIKLAGAVAADPTTGQLRATFADNPQFPFSDLRFHFHGGPRAPLANPQTCGSFAASTLFTSWAGQEAPGASPAFAVDWDGSGAPCPAVNPFAPHVIAGSTDTGAGAFTPFQLELSRADREQNVVGLTETLPPGLLARIAGVPLCGEADANAGSCGAASQIGTVSVTAGPGEAPITIDGGKVYLTGPYRGAPYGLSIVQPAVAGPFNLGDVVVRAAIHVDPSTAAITVTSDPIPQLRDGVPFRLRAMRIEISRAGGFAFNPTNCSQHTIVTTVTGSQGTSTPISNPFAVSGCASLPFHPRLTVATSGKTSKLNGASLTVKVSQQAGEANIHKVNLQVPNALPSRLSTLNHACTSQQFEANPAGCPASSVIGRATAVTPLLPSPLTGPAFIVSHGGAAFPDVEFVLQGGGVAIVLDGSTQIKNGITYSRFETVPDAPISSFEAVLPEGPHSILAANGDLCAKTKIVTVTKRVTKRVHGRTIHVLQKRKRTVATSLTIPALVTAQSGVQTSQQLAVSVTGCPTVASKKQARSAQRRHKRS